MIIDEAKTRERNIFYDDLASILRREKKAAQVKKHATTILICTPDIRSERVKRCIDAVKSTTRGIKLEIIVSDNCGAADFNHATAINRVLAFTTGDFVTIDDDCVVTGAWLEAALDYGQQAGAGVVAFREHKKSYKDLHSKHWKDALQFTRDGDVVRYLHDGDFQYFYAPATGSCCWLMRCGYVLDDKHYSKYYFDPSYCLSLWAKDIPTIVVNESVIHEGAATARHTPPTIRSDRETFRGYWLDNSKGAAPVDELYKRHAETWAYNPVKEKV